MKAIEYTKYGSPEVLQLIVAQKPFPKDNEILLKIQSTTVSASECTFRQGNSMSRLFTGIIRPKLKKLGEELSGKI